MALEFGTFATVSDRRRLYTDEERERYFSILHPRFTTLWFADHPQYDALEAWTSATYFAARHPRFKVGTLVLSQSYRNPGLLAKMGATLQRLSQGRLTMGLGAGWEEGDYKAYNYEFPRPGVRVAQLAEAIEVLRTMWTTNPATYHGEYYHVEAADSAPLPDPPIPILVGTNGKKAMQVAARLADIWEWDMCDNYADMVNALRRSCIEYGRSPDEIKIYAEAQLDFPADPADFVGSEEMQQYPGIGPSNHLGPTPQAAIEQIKPYRDLGVAQLIVGGSMEELRRFSEEVVPAFD
jgi:alkanesulfonate monooxygenase SsuD/methylene tetrahydromethanopterin reductase-like flavin-dependent oxidoreductase (luciferase family)